MPRSQLAGDRARLPVARLPVGAAVKHREALLILGLVYFAMCEAGGQYLFG